MSRRCLELEYPTGVVVSVLEHVWEVIIMVYAKIYHDRPALRIAVIHSASRSVLHMKIVYAAAIGIAEAL